MDNLDKMIIEMREVGGPWGGDIVLSKEAVASIGRILDEWHEFAAPTHEGYQCVHPIRRYAQDEKVVTADGHECVLPIGDLRYRDYRKDPSQMLALCQRCGENPPDVYFTHQVYQMCSSCLDRLQSQPNTPNTCLLYTSDAADE